MNKLTVTIIALIVVVVGGYYLIQKELEPDGIGDQEKGILVGTVGFVGLPCPPEEIGGRKPLVPPCDGPYPNYEIAVYRTDGKTVVTKIASNVDGTYEIYLNSGNYSIYTPSGLQDRIKTHQVTIVSGMTTKLDLVVDTGIR